MGVGPPPRDQRINSSKTKQISGVSAEQMARMEREMANLQRDLKLVEDSYGGDVTPSFLLRAPLIAPRMVWCCQPEAAAICSTVALLRRPL